MCLIDLQNHIGGSAEAKCVAVNPRRPEQLAVGASDAYARVYDRRMIKLCRVHSINISFCIFNFVYFDADHFDCYFPFKQIGDMSGQNDRQIEDNLSRNCVTYFCPGHLNRFKDRKLCFTTKTITYLTFSPDGSELLVNMGSEQIYLYDLNNAQQPVVRQIIRNEISFYKKQC